MNKLNKIRLPLDIMMTLVSIVLMGGNYLFPADIVHEILGAALFVLWGVHFFLTVAGMHRSRKQFRHDKLRKIIPRIILALLCAYGLYAFITRGVWK